ncbi:hypothetical protein PHYPSEUDO_000895 [Phytophthora pseudosyringae]|uniref:Uncharacterized protein n=1 Tax=Phytophthora pseudosyringae TaxID=221518 RepID=A0A8T1W1A4_9STRA|nr:hypothetical protein PHYPSEUDO_000895 [Phytophthora pseudosyringae]
MEAHAALQVRNTRQVTNDLRSSPGPYLDATPSTKDDNGASSDFSLSSASIDDLATQLRNLWQREKNQQQEQANSSDPLRDDDNALPAVKAALQKIGSREKNELLLHLLEQQDALQLQRSEVAAFGETIAAQLLHQQHELRQKYREQISTLEVQLHDALHFNPQVATLQAKVDELEESNREHEQKLRFAVQKLQRSRKREKELKMMNDPLWD